VKMCPEVGFIDVQSINRPTSRVLRYSVNSDCVTWKIKNAYPADRACIRPSVVIFQLENHGCIKKTFHMKVMPLEATQIFNILNLKPITNSTKQSLFQANKSSTGQEFPLFFGTQIFPPSLGLANCPFSEPDQSTPRSTKLFRMHFNIIRINFSILPRVIPTWRPTNL